MTGWRLLFWLHTATRALSESGYWSGVVISSSIRQPMTRASRGESSMFMLVSAPAPLPYLHPVSRREIELLARLDAEGLVPGVEIAHGVGAVFGGRGAVDDQALAQRRRADLLPPVLGKAQEEKLLGAEPRSACRRLAGECQAPGVE